MNVKRRYNLERRTLGLFSIAVLLLAGVMLLPVTNSLAGVPAARAASVSVSIKASHHAEISFGVNVQLHGLVTSNGTPTPLSSVTLEAKPFPYQKPFHAVGSATTGQNGSYTFLQTPSHNTKYRVVVTAHPKQRSTTATVYVQSKFSTCTFQGSPTQIRVSCPMSFPRNVHEQGRRVYWYLGLNHSRRMKHVATTRIPAPAKPGLVHLTHVYRVKAGWTFANYYVVTRDLPDQGLGLPTCLDHSGFWVGGNQCPPPASLSTKTSKP